MRITFCNSAGVPQKLTARNLAPLLLGLTLNPINSSIIATALVPIGDAFHANAAQTAWLIAALYIATAIGQPLMGRLADIYGSVPVFYAGIILTVIAGIGGSIAPSLGVLIAWRVVLGFGTSAAYPAVMILLRRYASDERGRLHPGTLSAVTIAGQVSIVIGPTLGGLLVEYAGWRTTVIAVVPVALCAGILGAFWLPRGTSTRSETFDMRLLAKNWRLIALYARYVGIYAIFYSVFYGFPQWLEQAHHASPAQAGLLMLPTSLVAIGCAMLAAKMRPKTALLLGCCGAFCGAVFLLVLHAQSPAFAVLAASAVLGIPNGLNPVSEQATLSLHVDANAMGIASGLLRTAGYTGAMLASGLIALSFHPGAGDPELHRLATILIGIAALLVVIAAGRVFDVYTRAPRCLHGAAVRYEASDSREA